MSNYNISGASTPPARPLPPLPDQSTSNSLEGTKTTPRTNKIATPLLGTGTGQSGLTRSTSKENIGIPNGNPNAPKKSLVSDLVSSASNYIKNKLSPTPRSPNTEISRPYINNESPVFVAGAELASAKINLADLKNQRIALKNEQSTNPSKKTNSKLNSLNKEIADLEKSTISLAKSELMNAHLQLFSMEINSKAKQGFSFSDGSKLTEVPLSPNYPQTLPAITALIKNLQKTIGDVLDDSLKEAESISVHGISFEELQSISNTIEMKKDERNEFSRFDSNKIFEELGLTEARSDLYKAEIKQTQQD